LIVVCVSASSILNWRSSSASSPWLRLAQYLPRVVPVEWIGAWITGHAARFIVRHFRSVLPHQFDPRRHDVVTEKG
jgi:hypothetical protein